MAKKKAFLLRIDPALHDDLRRWADAELRSVNGQIEFVLRQAIRRRKGEAEEADDRAVTGGEGGGDDVSGHRPSAGSDSDPAARDDSADDPSM